LSSGRSSQGASQTDRQDLLRIKIATGKAHENDTDKDDCSSERADPECIQHNLTPGGAETDCDCPAPDFCNRNAGSDCRRSASSSVARTALPRFGQLQPSVE